MHKISRLTVMIACLSLFNFPRVILASPASSGVAASMAAEAVLSEEKYGPPKTRILTFTGTVTAKSTAVTTQGSRQKISAVDRAGFLSVFVVTEETEILNEDNDPVRLDWIGQNDKVLITYTSGRGGIKTAQSVKKIRYFKTKE